MIGWRDEGGQRVGGSLFETFAALARGEAWSFPALRPHQREPWHAFTVQVAAMAMIHASVDALPEDGAEWEDLLLDLTPDHPGGEAWSLVVDDWTKPALLQPPLVSMADRAAYKSPRPTPDALDMLVTSRNHDVKQEQMIGATAEEWLFALVALQTAEGFQGAGHYGISRMNGGFSNRMALGIRPTAGGAAAAFRRDVLRLVEDARARPDRRDGIRLLWTVAWDGTRSLAMDELDELYVEVCRRVRLVDGPDGIRGLAAGSQCARVAAKEIGGNTRDPWAPLVIDTKKDSQTAGKLVSVTAGAAGFGYRQMTRLLDPAKTTLPPLARLSPRDDEAGLSIVAAALARGQGKTEGLHRRAIRTSRVEEVRYNTWEALDRIGGVAGRRATEAGEAADKLKYALYALLQGAPSETPEHKKIAVRLGDKATEDRARKWLKSFHDAVDETFFDAPFWKHAAKTPEKHLLKWREQLQKIAKRIFDRAAASAPGTEVRRIRAIARAGKKLDASLDEWVRKADHGE